MVEPVSQTVDGLQQAEAVGTSRQDQLPEVALQRIADVDFKRLLQIAQDALEEFAWAVDRESSGVEFVGLSIVGSFLTDEFEPHQSDLDIYLLTDEEYENSEAFCRMLLDPHSGFRDELYDTIPREVTYVDPLGLWVDGAHRNVIREPSLTLKQKTEEN